MIEIRKEKIDDKRDLILTKYYTDDYVEHLQTEDELKYASQYFDSYIKEEK